MKYFCLVLLAAAAAFLTGCASTPASPVKTGSQLEVEFTLAGEFAPEDSLDPGQGRYYFIAIDADNVSETYPLPVVGPSGAYGWGNGWGTSDKASESKGITGYLRYDSGNDPANWYDILPGSKLLSSGPPQSPVAWNILNGGRTMRAVIDFSQIAGGRLPEKDISDLQINIICLNRIPADPNDPAPGRKWDALGYKTERDCIDIDVRRSYTWTGTDPEGDVSDPNLDITEWQVSVVRE